MTQPITVGVNHVVADCSGINSGRKCVVLSWNDPRSLNAALRYPFVGGRTPKTMKWVPVQFMDGTIDFLPKSRLLRRD